MIHVEASAPGKLVLAGEYAVLEGGCAISAAVDVRALVTVTPSADKHSLLRIENSGEHYAFHQDGDGSPVWQTSPGQNGTLLEKALMALMEPETELSPCTITLDTRDFYITGNEGQALKSGIGSSAALAVALVSALRGYTGREPDYDDCDRVHKDFQGGKGSGIDVATSWYGGVIALAGQSGAGVRASRLDWISGLHILPVWTGVPASTTARLRKLAEFSAAVPDTYKNSMQALCSSSENVLDCWRSNDVGNLLQAISAYARCLAEFDANMNIGIWSEIHQQLGDLAKGCGAVYKPSGAGGGDYGLAFASNPLPLQQLQDKLLNQGLVQQVPGWTDQGLEVVC